MEGVDYSDARPDPDQLYAAGKRFVVRYLAYKPNTKVLGPDELATLQRRGFGVVLNWEQGSGDMLYGYDRGVAHAKEALTQANALGAPSSIPIYFSCDVDTVSSAQRQAAGDYLNGCASILGRNRVGVYGEFEVIEALVPTYAVYGWQTYAWSHGAVSEKAHLLQYQNDVTIGGGSVDLDRALQAQFGGWFTVSDPDYRPFGPPKRDIGARTADTMVADLWDWIGNGRSPWGTENAPWNPADGNGLIQQIASMHKKLDQLLARPELSDDQLQTLANKLASMTDVSLIKTALKDVLTKGTDAA